MTTGENLTKSRSWRSGAIKGVDRSSIFAPFDNYGDSGYLSTESVTGFNNQRLAGGRWSGGGPVYINRATTGFVPDAINIVRYSGGGSVLTQGTGRIEFPTVGIADLAIPTIPSDAQLDSDGTTAIARTQPTNPAFDLSTFIGELRMEGLPNLPGSAVRERTRAAKAAGSEYLNIEFGWSPLVRGVRDFAKVVNNYDQIVNQYQQGSNQLIKRNYDWPIVFDSKYTPCGYSMSPAIGFFSGGGRYQSVYQRKWFEASYTYYLPTGGAINDQIRRYGSYARKLLGVELSPEVLWNLSPWSWAVDWFSNAGDVIHNVSSIGKDGLVMSNAYIMCHTQRRTVDTGSAFGQIQSRTYLEESKVRRGATPYGFGVSFSGLTAKQSAIIAALGLSRW